MKNLIIALALLLPQSAPAAAVKNPNMLVYAQIGDTDSFDPAWSYDTASHNIIANVYETLIFYSGSELSEKGLMPMLATKVPSLANGLISKDGLSYRFPIRKGVKFHDGSELTPEDARYSMLRFMLFDRDGGPSSLLLEPLLGVNSTRDNGKIRPGIHDQAAKAVTVQGQDLVFRLKKPYAPFLGILANFGSIVSKPWCASHEQWDGRPETWEKFNNPLRESSYLNEHTNGTGPYQLERLDRRNKEIVLARFPGYWRGAAKIEKVVIKTIDEFATRKLMLQAGDADVIYGPQMYFNQLQNIPGVELMDGLQNLERSSILFFTYKINPVANPYLGSGKLDGEGITPEFFSDINIRKAFAYSVDYEGYIRDMLRGKGRQASSFIPPGLVGYRKDGKKYTLDLKKAEEHFKKAWGGQVWDKGFKFTMVFNSGSAPAQSICQMIKKNVESINPKFKIDIRSLQWSTFLEQSQAGKMAFFLGAWQADFPDAHNFAFPLLHSQGYFPSKQKYSNPKVDALIERAVSTLDLKKREALYQQLQDMVYEDVPHVHMAEGMRYRSQRSWVKGFVFRPIFPDSPYGSYYYDLRKE
ncbi:MAG: ABC transporter substrate-binding protein [Elusimicrobia bacterium]|nr:ABC transporter substrate-binding protein [Elusimicrobiota bacterium]